MSALTQASGIAQQMAAFGADWVPREPLGRHTSLEVGGCADLVRIHHPQRLPELVEFLAGRGASWRFLGGGSNLLVVDEDLDDVVLQLARDSGRLEFHGNRVAVPAAANLGTTVMECAKRNLGGMEGLVGVPGTVGGALRMNAGAYGMQIGDVVRALQVFRGSTARIETLSHENVRFEYRHTSFGPDDILLSVTLELPQRDYAEILEKIKQYNQKRRASQPINEKSAGCIFKNPPGLSTGQMIDELGLKGQRVGGAVVSERHANFIVNRFQATAFDIFRLMEVIRERVRAGFGAELEEEVVIWKN
ncbi:MAG: UDP-N-acetylmuramate dehydrogenase [Acidobacteria bacterium]|nr:UDP-N-acetylmuramate dehydrogenase [Acidobacteriota bacterium]